MTSIKYKSTRGGQQSLSFEDVVMAGLADDKGLFVPETIPTFTMAEIELVKSLHYKFIRSLLTLRMISTDAPFEF
jgi:threonine synthase